MRNYSTPPALSAILRSLTSSESGRGWRMNGQKSSREEAEGAVERLKYTALLRRFPSMDDTTRLVLSRIMTDGRCTACNSPAKREAGGTRSASGAGTLSHLRCRYQRCRTTSLRSTNSIMPDWNGNGSARWKRGARRQRSWRSWRTSSRSIGKRSVAVGNRPGIDRGT